MLKFNQKGSDKPVIKIDALEIRLLTSTYSDITALGYTETDRRE